MPKDSLRWRFLWRQVPKGIVLGILIAVVAAPFARILNFLILDLLVPVALLCGLVAATPLRPLLWALAGALSAVIVLVTATPVIAGPVAGLVRRDRLEQCDALIVLSSSVCADGRRSQNGFERLVHGIYLLDREWAPVLITTRVCSAHPVASADELQLLALMARDVETYEIGPAASTRDEAVMLRALAEEKGWKQVLVVTSPTHSQRAAAAFERVGLDVVSHPCPERDFTIGHLDSARHRLRAFERWLYEFLATALYRRRGWI